MITKNDGNYLIENVPIGSIEIEISKAGYKSIFRTIKIEYNNYGYTQTNIFDFIL